MPKNEIEPKVPPIHFYFLAIGIDSLFIEINRVFGDCPNVLCTHDRKSKIQVYFGSCNIYIQDFNKPLIKLGGTKI